MNLKKFAAVLLCLAIALSSVLWTASAEDEGVAMEILYGDVTGNGKTTLLDAAYIFFSNLGIVRLSDEQKLAGDVNGDGVVDKADMKCIAQYAVKTVPCFPVEEAVWPEGTVIETEYDEYGLPKLNLFRQFKNSTHDNIQATIAGTAIMDEGEMKADFEFGLRDIDFYLDIVFRRFGSIQIIADIAHIKVIEKDLGFDIVFPSINTYVTELAGDEEQASQLKELFDEIEKYGFFIHDLLVEGLKDYYLYTSETNINGVKYICETYKDFQCFFTTGGSLKRIQSTDGKNIFIIRSEKTTVKDSEFRIPFTYIKLTPEKLEELFDSLFD